MAPPEQAHHQHRTENARLRDEVEHEAGQLDQAVSSARSRFGHPSWVMVSSAIGRPRSLGAIDAPSMKSAKSLGQHATGSRLWPYRLIADPPGSY